MIGKKIPRDEPGETKVLNPLIELELCSETNTQCG
jgi:hypothetical protein